ncbi:unnamed protein product [Calypogeia fissa]
MSGATMATGPRPKSAQAGSGAKEPSDASLGGVMGSLSVIDLQLVAFILVFSASGLVPVLDLVFPIFLSGYAFFLSAFVFPTYGASKPPDVFRGNRAFQLWVVMGTAIGLFLPLAYVLGGFAQGDTIAVRDAASHLFLLSFQILTENIINGLGIFSLPVRSLLPLLYTTRRLFAIWGWVVGTWMHTDSRKHSGPDMPVLLPDYVWTWFGRSLAVANFVYFFINLFFFLIPMFLPRAFETYFNQRAMFLSEHQGKGKGKDSWFSGPKHTEEHSNQGQEPEKKAQ